MWGLHLMVTNNKQYNSAFNLPQLLENLGIVKPAVCVEFQSILGDKYADDFEMCGDCEVIGLNNCECDAEEECDCDACMGVEDDDYGEEEETETEDNERETV